MNPQSALLTAQGSAIQFLVDLSKQLSVHRVGLFASHSQWFRDYTLQNPHIEHAPFVVLKEWEITQSPPPLDRAILERYDREFGPGELWNALRADRRMMLGPLATLHQDYRRRHSDEWLLRALQGHLVGFEWLWQQVQPQVVLAYNCVTVGDYVAYLFARLHQVPYLNLRATKIRDYVQYETSPYLSSPTTQAEYERRRALDLEDDYTHTARDYLQQVRAENALYEGVRQSAPRRFSIPWRGGVNLLRQEWEYRTSTAGRDNHLVSPLYSALAVQVLNPLRARHHDRRLAPIYLSPTELPRTNYVFFPLHSEPEVALMVYARPYQNQIEVVRNLAASLPINTQLVVKDHPLAYTRRSFNYYRKLLDIPNVRLVHPRVQSRLLIQNAQAVVVISGSIGLEAVILGKPVACLGEPPYALLPPTMVRRLTNLNTIADDLHQLMRSYRLDEQALVHFIAAQVSLSASVKLYSVLIGRRNVVTTGTSTYAAEVEKLAELTQTTLARWRIRA